MAFRDWYHLENAVITGELRVYLINIIFRITVPRSSRLREFSLKVVTQGLENFPTWVFYESWMGKQALKKRKRRHRNSTLQCPYFKSDN
jgi:hypothetical protein